MASKLLNVLNKVEHGRNLCITRANEAGFEIDPNAGFDVLADCFTEIHPDYIPPNVDYPRWVRPSHLPDLKTILANADTIDDNGTTMYPLYAISYEDEDEDIIMNSYMFSNVNAANRIGVYTSDGTYYSNQTNPQLPINTGFLTHTWTSTPHYIIVYGIDIYKSDGNAAVTYMPDNNWSTTLQNHNNITQVCFGNCRTYGINCSYMSSIYEGLQNHLVSIECTEDTSWPSGWNTQLNCIFHALECVNLPTITLIRSSLVSNGSYKLYEVNLPELTAVEGSNTVVFRGCVTSSGTRLGAISVLNIPKLKRLGTASQFISGAFYGIKNPSLDLSNLEIYNVNANASYDDTYWYQFALQCLSYIKLGAVTCYNGGANWGPRLELRVRNFDYKAGSSFGTMNFPELVYYTFREPFVFAKLNAIKLRAVDLSEGSWIVAQNQSVLNLGVADFCTSVVFPSHISPINIDISGYPILDNASLEDLIEKLPNTTEHTIKMSQYCKDSLTAEQLETLANSGWSVIV